jgi:hypothetical protein
MGCNEYCDEEEGYHVPFCSKRREGPAQTVVKKEEQMSVKGASEVQKGDSRPVQTVEIIGGVALQRVRIPLGSPPETPAISPVTAVVGAALPPEKASQGANAPARRAIDRCACGHSVFWHDRPGEAPVGCAMPVGGFCTCAHFTPHPQPDPAFQVPLAIDDCAPVAAPVCEFIADEPPTATVVTPWDAQRRAERLLGLTATITRLGVAPSDGREPWRAKIEAADGSMVAYYYGTREHVFDVVRLVLEGRGL